MIIISISLFRGQNLQLLQFEKMNSDTQQKQAYLRSQIIEKGYPAEGFVDFLMKVKEGGESLDIWNLQELKLAVESYKKNRSKLAQKNIEDNNNGLDPKYQIITEKKIIEIIQQNSKKVQYEKYNLYDYAFSKKIESVKFQKYHQNISNKIEILVHKPVIKVSGGVIFGIGKTSVLWFTVQSKLIENQEPIIVERTDADFDWLRTTLLRLYPGYVIPPLQKGLTTLQDKKLLQQRSKSINIFLQALSDKPIIFNTKLLIAFLTQSDQSRFSQFKMQINTTSFIKILNNLQTLNGELELEISNENRNINKFVETYSNSIDEVFEEISINVSNIKKSYTNLVDSFYGLANNFASLHQKYADLAHSVPKLKNEDMIDILITLNNIMVKWGESLHTQKKVIDDNLNLLFKYKQQQNFEMKQFLKKRLEAEDEYLKFKLNLLKKKERMYSDKTKWDIPASIVSKITEIDNLNKQQVMEYFLPKETKQQKQMRDWVSYLNKRCQLQFMYLIEINSKRYIKSFYKLGKQLQPAFQKQLSQIEKLSKGLERHNG